MFLRNAAALSLIGAVFAHPALAQESAADLAKMTANPVAALISVPFQFSYKQEIGPAEEGKTVFVNIQPVIPIDLNADWNLISRTILPVVWQEDVVPGAGTQFGLGDTVQSLFFSPKKPTADGWIWRAGLVLLLRTATNNLLSAEKWGAGPTAVVLKQEHGWTYGMLANHIWSFAGNSSPRDVNTTFLQPFVAYTTPTAWTYALNTEATYQWDFNEWAVPLVFAVSKVTKLGDQMISFAGGVRY